MKTTWIVVLGVVMFSLSGCCGGSVKAACEEACAKSEESQKQTCASMTGEAKTTCEKQIAPNIAECKKACAAQ